MWLNFYKDYGEVAGLVRRDNPWFCYLVSIMVQLQNENIVNQRRDNLVEDLKACRKYFDSGVTRPYRFRKAQLQKLKETILENEQGIYEALKSDLGKSPEESWVTEIGMVISELNSALKNLKRWMEPERVQTNLVNLPSSSRIIMEPLGAVLIISPWNYPFLLTFSPLVGAMAAGNCVVIKPGEQAPATQEIMKKIIEENFPKEYLHYVEGDGAEVIPPMMESFRFDHVFYTGSTSVGKSIYKMAAEKLIPVTLELGGKSPCIVEDDANIQVAARRIAVSKFSNAGQMCIAPDYVLVHESLKEKLIDALKNTIKEFYTDKPEECYNYGKIINQKQFDRLVVLIRGLKNVSGGGMHRESLYIEPTIVVDPPVDSPIMKEEIFGPILPVIGFRTAEEAKKIIDLNPNPLSFYLFTSNGRKEKEWIESVQFGGGCVNNTSWHFTNHHLPFGGRGASGLGSYHGKYSFETFSHRKSVMKTPTWFDPKIKYPPFKGKLNLFRRVIR